MLFPMSETFKKSQMSEFFDVSAGCISLYLHVRLLAATFQTLEYFLLQKTLLIEDNFFQAISVP